jgi:hypothetical protein
LCKSNDARQHHPSAEINDACILADERANGLIRADCDDAVPAHRQRLHDAAACILGVNLAVNQHEIGRRGDAAEANPSTTDNRPKT